MAAPNCDGADDAGGRGRPAAGLGRGPLTAVSVAPEAGVTVEGFARAGDGVATATVNITAPGVGVRVWIGDAATATVADWRALAGGAPASVVCVSAGVTVVSDGATATFVATDAWHDVNVAVPLAACIDLFGQVRDVVAEVRARRGEPD
jgi:hypothetical protein